MKFQWWTPIVVSHRLVKLFVPKLRGFGENLVGILKIPPNVTFFISARFQIFPSYVLSVTWSSILRSFSEINLLVCEISRVKLCKKVVFFAFLMTRCALDSRSVNTAIYATCSVGNCHTCGQFSFGWLQYDGSYDGAKWAQNNEFDKLACEPCLTTRCVRAMKRMAFELQSYVENLVLFRSCDFRPDSSNSLFVVTRQSWDRLRFARMDLAYFWLVAQE
jgi:hypothetical protein